MYQWHHLPLLTSSYSYHGISMTLLLRTCPRVWGHHYPALVPWLPLKERCYTGRSSTQSLVRRFTGTSVSDPDPDWIRIQGSSGNRFGIRIRFQGLKKRSKMSNNHNTILLFSDFYTILLLFSDFYNILSFNGLLLIRKSYNYEVIKKNVRYGSGKDWDFWLDPDLMNMDPNTDRYRFFASGRRIRIFDGDPYPECPLKYVSWSATTVL